MFDTRNFRDLLQHLQANRERNPRPDGTGSIPDREHPAPAHPRQLCPAPPHPLQLNNARLRHAGDLRRADGSAGI